MGRRAVGNVLRGRSKQYSLVYSCTHSASTRKQIYQFVPILVSQQVQDPSIKGLRFAAYEASFCGRIYNE